MSEQQQNDSVTDAQEHRASGIVKFFFDIVALFFCIPVFLVLAWIVGGLIFLIYSGFGGDVAGGIAAWVFGIIIVVPSAIFAWKVFRKIFNFVHSRYL